MNKNLTTHFKEKLRDPIWQSIGVFLTFITLLSSLFVGNLIFRNQPPAPNRLMFSSDTSKELTDFSEPLSKRLQILIDGKEEKGLRLFIFRLEYKGKEPVRPTDFEVPIRGHIPNSRKLLGVQKSVNLEGPFRYDAATETRIRDPRPPLNFEASLLDDHTFEIKPLLMNPGEWAGLEIYTAAVDPTNYVAPKDSTEQYKELSSEITWSCHVANVDCPGSIDLERDFDFIGFDEPSFLQVSVMHRGWSVYSIVLFTIANLVALVLLARTAGFQNSRPIVQLFLFCLAIASSIASAEVVADWLLPFLVFGVRLSDGQPVYAWIILGLDIFILGFLAVLSVWKAKRARRREFSVIEPQIE